MVALYTACLTVLIGVLVFVFGQIIVKFFIEPIHEQKRLIGEIADCLIFYANVYGNPGTEDAPRDPRRDKRVHEASESLRQYASRLSSKTYLIPWYRLWECLGIVRRYRDINEASRDLMVLSNSIYKGDSGRNHQARERISRYLNILKE